MAHFVIRGFAARKLRALLTGVAIALGVTLMAGTYILTDTINRSFSATYAKANKGNDVVLSSHQALGRDVNAQVSPITQTLLNTVRSLPGVATASGQVLTGATLLDAAGKRLNPGSESYLAGLLPAPFEPFRVTTGKFPSTAEQVAIDRATADQYSLKVGQSIEVAGRAPASHYTISGIVTFAGDSSYGGASVAVLTPKEAQRISDEIGTYDQIDVKAANATTSAALANRIRRIAPATIDVRTGSQQAAKQTSDLQNRLKTLRIFLLVFAYISLIVGAFIIFNTFSITVAQRAREFALLRMLGASPRQVLSTVISESLLLGLIGSALGLLAGIGAAPALDSLFKLFGANIPAEGTVLQTRTVLVSMLVGTIITVLSGLVPARRATRVPPIAALREGLNPDERRRRGLRRIRISALISPMARVLGGLLAWRGLTARLARDNARRQPGRTMVTAAALMIGVALVTFISIFAAGEKATINHAVDQQVAGNLIVQSASASTGATSIPAGVASAIAHVDGVQSVTAVARTQGKVAGTLGNEVVTGVNPATIGHAYRIDWKHGGDATLSRLGSTGTVVSEKFAAAERINVGQQLDVLTPSGQRVKLVVRGVARDNAHLLGELIVDKSVVQSRFGQRDDTVDFVTFAPGVAPAKAQLAIDRLLAGRYPQAQTRTTGQLKAGLSAQINTMLTLIYVLLALSVLVSLFGIINTLVLSIHERTRELGTLRALGTSRRQIREIVRYESVITALIGGILGLAVGTLLAVGVVRGLLAGQAFVFAIPVATMLGILVLAGAAGIAAAGFPARRAAQIDILAALATE